MFNKSPLYDALKDAASDFDDFEPLSFEDSFENAPLISSLPTLMSGWTGLIWNAAPRKFAITVSMLS